MEAIFGSEEGKGEFELIDEMRKHPAWKDPAGDRGRSARQDPSQPPVQSGGEMEKTVSEILQ